ncbi:MAG TPA: hypothetical protein VMV41_07465 [Cellulomonadaceae bacterium]|nr:hypothetical protein [Cellulomonadaceae bacterium]
MRRGEQFPDEQAEIVFNDVFLEYLEDLLPEQREDVLVEVVRLCRNPAGNHPLSNRGGADRLAGWNTVDVLDKEHRVVFGSHIVDGVGLVEVLCAGPRRGNAVYDLAVALSRTGRLSKDEVTEIWQALVLMDVVAETVDLDGWDYRPPPAPDGMVKAAVTSGLLDEPTARVLSIDELTAAMAQGWDEGRPDPAAALAAALHRARAGVDVGDATRILHGRRLDRCAVILPRAGTACVRRAGHGGPHRATP